MLALDGAHYMAGVLAGKASFRQATGLNIRSEFAPCEAYYRAAVQAAVPRYGDELAAGGARVVDEGGDGEA